MEGVVKFFRSLRSRTLSPTFKTVAPPLEPDPHLPDAAH